MGNSITDGWIRVDPIFRTERVPRPRYQRADDRPDASPFPQRRDRPETAGRIILAASTDIARNNGPIKLKRLRQHRLDVRRPATTGSRWCLLAAALRPLLVAATKWILPRRSDDSIRCWNAPRSRRFPMWITIRRSTTAAAECPEELSQTAALPSGSFRLFADGAAGRQKASTGV